MWTERQAIEIFHLLFIAHLGRRVEKALFVLKGGCNLRFFAKSIRYSEDIDFDMRTMARGTLKGNVDAVLASPSLVQSLRVKKIALGPVSAPKQTDTTQRWKVALVVEGRSIPTKIEFSRRPVLDAGHVLEPVDAEMTRTYELPPVLVQHYGVEAAFWQKIVALSRRAQVQARDVFDLKLLLDRGAGKESLPPEVRKEIPAAIENALRVGFDEFSGQVRAYLTAEYQDYYGKREIWEKVQDEVVAALEART